MKFVQVELPYVAIYLHMPTENMDVDVSSMVKVHKVKYFSIFQRVGLQTGQDVSSGQFVV